MEVKKNMNKTVPTSLAVTDFIASIADPEQRHDSEILRDIMTKASGVPAVMWGTSIIGFGNYHYKSAAGREGDWAKIGFAPRKGQFSLYITGDASQYAKQLDAMGSYKTGKGCIYIKRLADVDQVKLADLIQLAYDQGHY